VTAVTSVVKLGELIRAHYSQAGSVVTGAGVHGDEEIDRRALEDAVVDAASGRGM